MSFIRARASQIIISFMIIIAGLFSIINSVSFERNIVIVALMVAGLLTLRMISRLAALLQRNASNIQELKTIQQAISRKASDSGNQLKACDRRTRQLLELAASGDNRTRKIFELSAKSDNFQTQYIELSRQLHFTLGEGFSKLAETFDSELDNKSLGENND